MKTSEYISALLLVASTLLQSCSLLCSSPLPHYGDYGPRYHGGRNKVYSGIFRVPAEGGVYKINCSNDRFYISRILDSTMPMPEPHRRHHSNCRCFSSTNLYKPVNDLDYDGPFYTIACNQDEHNWVITVDPIMATASEDDTRTVCVSMWDDSDESDIVFLFEQSGGPVAVIQ